MNLFPKQKRVINGQVLFGERPKPLWWIQNPIDTFQFYMLNKGADGRHGCSHAQHK